MSPAAQAPSRCLVASHLNIATLLLTASLYRHRASISRSFFFSARLFSAFNDAE
jgi:hypothetical protein